jgi:ribosome-binding protein aMBF1 (putative translation factor)
MIFIRVIMVVTMEISERRRRAGRPLAKVEIPKDRTLSIGDAAAFGALVRAERVARGLPQGELAARLGVSRGLLAGLERGDRGVRLDLALKVLTDLGVTLVAVPSGLSARSPGPDP